MPVAKASRGATTELPPAAPDLVLEDEDGVETAKVLPEPEPELVRNAVNEQPAPKKFKPGTRVWVKAQVEAIYEASYNLKSFFPKLTDSQLRKIREAREALEDVARIGGNFNNIDRGSRELIELWNRQHGYQLEGEHFVLKVREAVGYEPGIDRWTRLITKMSEGDSSSWFTRDNFECLISTYGGRPDGLEDLEKQEGLPAWEPAVPEMADDPAGAES